MYALPTAQVLNYYDKLCIKLTLVTVKSPILDSIPWESRKGSPKNRSSQQVSSVIVIEPCHIEAHHICLLLHHPCIQEGTLDLYMGPWEIAISRLSVTFWRAGLLRREQRGRKESLEKEVAWG